MSDLPRMNVDMTKALVFCVVFVTVAALIAAGKVDASYLKYMITWMIPSPLSINEEKE